MRILYPNVAGLDVRKKTVVAAVMVQTPVAGLPQEKRTLGTMTMDLLALSDWLMGHGVTHVAMESRANTGSRSSTSWKTALR